MYPGGVPWAWGINGVMSVVASVLAIMVALNWGFTVTTLSGWLATWRRWPTRCWGAGRSAGAIWTPTAEPERRAVAAPP